MARRLTLWHRWIALTFLAFAFVSFSSSAHSQRAHMDDINQHFPRAVIIIDGSGSMWGKLGRMTKMQLTQLALARALPDIAPLIDLGLVSYGHRRKRNCSDIEVIADPGRNSTATLFGYINALRPRGKTPITSALEAAADAIQYRSRPGTIVLLSDGYENCRRDPCAVANLLRKKAVNLTIHVIGLGLKSVDHRRIQCIAKKGGGRLLVVSNIDELENALISTLGQLGASPTPRVVSHKHNSTPPIPQDPPGMLLRALIAANGPPLLKGLKWRVYRGNYDQPGDEIYAGAAPQPAITAKPGKYTIEVKMGLASARREITVGSKRLISVAIPLNLGRLRLSALADDKRQPLDRVTYTISKKLGAKTTEPWQILATSREKEPEYYLPAGHYTISAEQGLARVKRDIAIRVGETSVHRLLLNVGKLRLWASERAKASPLDQMLFLVYEDDPDAPNGYREVARSAANRPTFALPAGSYQVIARRGTAEQRERVTVTPGTLNTKRIALRSSTLQATAYIAGDDKPLRDRIAYKIFRLKKNGDAAPIPMAQTSQPLPSLNLKAGRYRVVGKLGQINVETSVDVRLRPGELKRIQLNYAAGRVVLKLPPSLADIDDHHVAWRLNDQSGHELWATNIPNPRVLLASGRYNVVASLGGHSYKATFSLLAGEFKTVIVAAE